MKFLKIIVIGMPLLSACDLISPCGQENLKQSQSPDGRYVVEVVEVNCGATTDYTYWVTVKDNQALIGGDETVATFEKGRNVDVSWAGNNRLVVHRYDGAEQFQKTENWRDLSIEYQ